MAILKTKVKYAELVARLSAFFKEVGKDDTLLDSIGVFTTERIRAMVRSGYSLDQNNKKKLKKLSESYKDMRRGAVKFRTTKDGRRIAIPEPDERLNEVDVTFFDPDFSNLTFTGQLMEALGFTKNAEKRQITVEVNDERRVGKYESLTNKEVAKHVSDNGRPFLGLDKTGVARVRAMVKTFLRKEIIKQRLRKR